MSGLQKDCLFCFDLDMKDWLFLDTVNRPSHDFIFLFCHLLSVESRFEVFKTLNGVSPDAFQNYFTRVNRSQRTRANTKNIVLPKVKSEAGKKAFSF